MRGSVRRGDGSWSFTIDLGPDPATGRRRQTRKRGFRTRKAAEVALAEVLADAQQGRHRRPARGTFGQYLTETWLPARRVDLRPSTVLGYEKAIRRRIVPFLGHVPLAALDAATLEAYFARLLTSGGRNGGPLSPKTVANAAGIIGVALGDAVRLRLLPHNAATEARLPRREHREMTAWSEAEATEFLAAVAGERLAPIWHLVLTTGLRRGELAGLRWRDVSSGAITVATTRVVADTVVTGEPKTRAGSRVIALDADTVAALGQWRRRHAEERLAAGPAWADHGLVLVDELGEPPHPETITRWWREAVARAGVPAIRLHDARHSAATILLRAGVPVKVVSQRLGHADVAVTMRVYQHVTAQDDAAAADAIGRALRGS